MSETYVPLARKWRPRSFADVVGQEEIVRALTNAVAQDRLAHAYLFSGPRGVGKTTTARLLAAAINCSASEKPTPEPCGACVACTEILEGRSIDALEIDGATHGKVDQARDLIEVVAFAPVRDRRKVFIIDEVHAISAAAFQALLKTLEEPPAHAVFILATTERHKIPATILSRCQRFDFRRLTDEEVGERLAEIARREGIPVPEPAALSALAAAATGSLRDALSLFDQAAARAGGAVTCGGRGRPPRRARPLDARRPFRVAPRWRPLRGPEGMRRTGGVGRRPARHPPRPDGPRPRRAFASRRTRPPPPPAGLSEDAAVRLAEFARATPYATLLRMLSLLSDADALLRRSDLPSLAFEVLLLKLAELPRLVPIEEFLSGKTGIPRFSTSSSASTYSGAGELPLFSSRGKENESEGRGVSPARSGDAGVPPAVLPSKKIPERSPALATEALRHPSHSSSFRKQKNPRCPVSWG